MLIIISNGIDLGSGSVLAFCSAIAASLAQEADAEQKFFTSIGALPAIVPILAALLVGALCGFINGAIIAKTGIPLFIATLGMQLLARGATYIYSEGRAELDNADIIAASIFTG